VKQMKDMLSGKQLEVFKRESSVMAQLRPHLNVVQVHYMSSAKSDDCSYLEFAPLKSSASSLNISRMAVSTITLELIK
jgi:hypothetical protein